MTRSILKAVFKRGGEAALAVALVLGLFFLGLYLLGRVFPEGTSLGEFVRGPSEPASAMIMPAHRRAVGPPEPRFVARLVDVYRKVKGKAANHLVWDDAQSGEPLENRHAVQTFDRSGATIAFNGRGEVELGENSLMVIRAREADVAGEPGRVALMVAQGDLSGEFAEARAGVPTEFDAGRARSRLVGDAKDSKLRVTVNPDRSTTFTVYRGATDVTVDAEVVRVTANHFITANPTGPLGEPVALPPVPDAIEPASHRRFTYCSTPPRVRFAWTAGPAADGYRFQLARDPKFHDLVVSRKVRGGELTHGNLAPGTYYWRVRGTLGWAETLPSEVRTLEIVEDRTPPALRVDFPDGPVDGKSVVLRGRAEPASEVFVLDQRIPVDDDGRFEWQIELPPGATVIVVEALDAAGNASYRSGVLSARY